MDNQSNLLVFASGKGLSPVAEGGAEIIAHDLLCGLHDRGFGLEAYGAIQLKDLDTLNRALIELKCNLEFTSTRQEIVTYSGDRLQVPVRTVFRYRLKYPTTLTTEEDFQDFFKRQIDLHQFPIALLMGESSPKLNELVKGKGMVPIFYAQNPLELKLLPKFKSLPLVLANSKFYQEKMRREHGIQAELLYPAVDLDRYRADENSHQYITMINPVVVKGIIPFLKVALALPQRKFLAVEGWGTPREIIDLIRDIPNVTYLQKQVDMRGVYSQTHILMVPSQWEEAFGRVTTEAQTNGIPVLASQVGGIPEAVGDGGMLVKDRQNPDAWLEGLRQLEARYDEYSYRARENAKKFSIENSVHRFLDILSAVRA